LARALVVLARAYVDNRGSTNGAPYQVMVHVDEGTLTAIRPDGSALAFSARPVLADDDAIVNSDARAGVTVEPDTITPTWHADSLDLDHITTSLMQRWVGEHPEGDVGCE